MKFRTLIVVCVTSLVPSIVAAQALTSLASVRVGYITRKNTLKPQGELKAQIDALDAQIAEASRFGRNGELRKLFAKGIALLNNRPWTDASEFASSLVLRTDRVVVDSSKPYVVRLEQIFAPSISLERPLTAKLALYKRPSGPPPAAGTPPPPPELVKELGTFEGVGRDLRESPFSFDLDVHDVADGTYLLIANVGDGTNPLGATNLVVALRKGLDETVTKLESDAKPAPQNLRAEILYPIDRMKQVNRGRLELRTFDPERDFAAAEAVALAAKNRSPDGPGTFGGTISSRPPTRSSPTAPTSPKRTRARSRFRSSSRCTALAALRTPSSTTTARACRRWPNHTATFSPHRLAIASTDRMAGDWVRRQPIPPYAGRRISANRT